MKHTCSALLLHCIDFRFGPKIHEWIEKNSLAGDVDVVAVAGAAKNLVSPQETTDKKFIMRQIEISKRLHDITEVIIMNHTDCGGYGGRIAFQDRDEERSHHFKDLSEAAHQIQEQFPEIKTRIVLADIEPTGEINFIEQK